MAYLKKIFLFFFVIIFLIPQPVFASLGVGVGVGKIRVDQKLKPGQIYKLPSITVINTGDVPSTYEVEIQHQEKQKERIPEEKWFTFTPREFTLEPGKVQEVKITLDLPIKIEPGDYFAYLEARPLKKATVGTTAVNIAAATKLNFSVQPGSFLTGIYYKLLSFWNVYTPWPQIVTVFLIIFLTLLVVKRFINVNIKIAKGKIPKWFIGIVALILFLAYIYLWIKFFNLI